MTNHAKEYLSQLPALIAQIDTEALGAAAKKLLAATRDGRFIFVAGNGGSAATATHFAADFGKNVVRGNDGRPRVLSLCDNIATITAYANDEGYEYAYSRQLANLMQAGDLLIVISASGNSPSVVKALEFAQERGGYVIAMTGFSGGILRQKADLCLHVESSAYESIEDLHSILCHSLVHCVKGAISAATAGKGTA